MLTKIFACEKRGRGGTEEARDEYEQMHFSGFTELVAKEVFKGALREEPQCYAFVLEGNQSSRLALSGDRRE